VGREIEVEEPRNNTTDKVEKYKEKVFVSLLLQ
jgi:hypothetical protein